MSVRVRADLLEKALDSFGRVGIIIYRGYGLLWWWIG